MLGCDVKVTQLRRSRVEAQSHIHLSESLSDLKILTASAPLCLPPPTLERFVRAGYLEFHPLSSTLRTCGKPAFRFCTVLKKSSLPFCCGLYVEWGGLTLL